MESQKGKFNIIVLGSGPSTSLPRLDHVISENKSCIVCQDALSNSMSKNKRNNVSIAVTWFDDSNIKRCIIIDVGKTMLDSCSKQLSKYNISNVDAIFLTHDHADAVFGLDDVRDLQKFELISATSDASGISGSGKTDIQKGFRILSGRLPIYLTQKTMNVVSQIFPYLIRKPEFIDEEKGILARRVAYLNFNIIDENETMTYSGMKIRVFPVFHGGEYISLGFVFGTNNELVYISDVKIIPEKTMEYLQSIPKINVLILDALDKNGIYSHMGLSEALNVISILKPTKAYLIGMTCSMGLHAEVEYMLQSKGLYNVFLAYDGLLIDPIAPPTFVFK